MGWNGKKNGELLGLMTLQGFDGLIYNGSEPKVSAEFKQVPNHIFHTNRKR
jgi:hypothetical protein